MGCKWDNNNNNNNNWTERLTASADQSRTYKNYVIKQYNAKQ